MKVSPDLSFSLPLRADFAVGWCGCFSLWARSHPLLCWSRHGTHGHFLADVSGGVVVVFLSRAGAVRGHAPSCGSGRSSPVTPTVFLLVLSGDTITQSSFFAALLRFSERRVNFWRQLWVPSRLHARTQAVLAGACTVPSSLKTTPRCVHGCLVPLRGTRTTASVRAPWQHAQGSSWPCQSVRSSATDA